MFRGFLKAARREAEREAGVRGKPGREPFAHYRYDGKNGEEEVAAYLVHVPSEEATAAEPGRDPEWATFDKAIKYLTSRRDPVYAEEHSRVLKRAKELLVERIGSL